MQKIYVFLGRGRMYFLLSNGQINLSGGFITIAGLSPPPKKNRRHARAVLDIYYPCLIYITDLG